METIVISAFIAAIILTAMWFWRWTLLIVGVVSLAVLSFGGRCDAATLEVAAIIESEADRAVMQDAIRDANAILSGQLGLDVTVTYVDVNTVAAHTHAQFLLDALKAYRLGSNVHRLADATVLFTRRDIRIGGGDYLGFATIGPVCSASASAIVELWGDGREGAVLAHELLHTVGVPHDHEPGWLMSENLGAWTSVSMSPDSIQTFRAAGGECFNAPAANPPASVQTPAAPSNGGGGAMDGPLFFVLLVLLVIWRQARQILQDRNVWKHHALQRLEILERANEQLRRMYEQR
jgi:hypothetical protein